MKVNLTWQKSHHVGVKIGGSVEGCINGGIVQGFGSRDQDLGIRLSGFELGVSSFGFRGSGFGYRVQVTGFHVPGSGMRAQGCEVRAVNSGFGFLDECSGLRG